MIMKKFYYLFAAAVSVALASCTNEALVEQGPGTQEEINTAINFGFDFQKYTRGGDIAGTAAADLLGSNFYVAGTKGTEGTKNPTENVVFNNYLVRYGINTAGTTESNTANWEYVGVTSDASHVKLSPAAVTAQTIKYWDYSTEQYDFLAFSTGTFKAVATTSGNADEIGVTAMKYGAGLASDAVAYTFDLPSVAALKNTYITDIKEVKKANYGKEVTLEFKNLGSKVRVALYETVPGYSVQAGSVKFYTEDGTTDFTDDKGTAAALISESTNSFASKGTVAVYFHNVGTSNESNGNYNKASATVTPGAGDTKKTFGDLSSDKFATAEGSETAGKLYLGRTLPTATFAGSTAASYYETVFPVSTSYPLTLRIDYTLIATDGQGETIEVKGAKAVVPATYTKWLPNYAYTYIFKISDNTNGWTGTGSEPSGLFPITFDAVVKEATDAQGEQTTITTVATPTITTYQQGHTYETNEYSKAGKKLYVQVMDNNHTPAVLVGSSADALYKLNTQTSDATPKNRSVLYAVSDANATEAKVMDALEKRTTELSADNVKGRNNLTLIKNANINNTVTSIENGVDDNPITVAAGEAAMIAISGLNTGTYAYVYDYTASAKTTVTEYQPVTVTPGSAIDGTTKTYYYIATTALDAIAVTTAEETVDNDYLYFSKTTNGTTTTTYSYISVSDKTTVPAGVVKVLKTTVAANTIAGNSTSTAANTFYFDTYITNNGLYAVKIIKVVN